MSIRRWPSKDPSDVLDYGIDWGPWLASQGLGGIDAIASATWSSSGGLTFDRPTLRGSLAAVWVSGGSRGHYTITCHITTTLGRTAERSVRINVTER
jgi:hypothetical protein